MPPTPPESIAPPGATPPSVEALDESPPGALELWALGPALKLSDHLAEIERMLTPVG